MRSCAGTYYDKHMSRTYLNGRVEISSLAVPTKADFEVLCALSQEDRQKIVSEELDRAYASGTSNRTLDDILVSALEKADKIKTQQKQHAL